MYVPFPSSKKSVEKKGEKKRKKIKKL